MRAPVEVNGGDLARRYARRLRPNAFNVATAGKRVRERIPPLRQRDAFDAYAEPPGLSGKIGPAANLYKARARYLARHGRCSAPCGGPKAPLVQKECRWP